MNSKSSLPALSIPPQGQIHRAQQLRDPLVLTHILAVLHQHWIFDCSVNCLQSTLIKLRIQRI